MFDNVLIDVDGHQGGRDAIRQFAFPGAKLMLAHVFGGHNIGGRASAMALALEREAGEQVLAMTLSKTKLEVETEFVFGESIGRGLQKAAGRLRADLLVGGSTRRAVLGRVLAHWLGQCAAREPEKQKRLRARSLGSHHSVRLAAGRQAAC